MIELFEDPYLWTGLSLAAIIFIIYTYGKGAIARWLDGEIARIQDELEQAKKLRAEAEQTLALYRQKQQEAMQEAEAIIAAANRDAARLRDAAARELRESLARHEQQAAERMARAEAEAVAALREATADLALQAGAVILREQLTPAIAEDYIDRVLAALPEQLAKQTAA